MRAIILAGGRGTRLAPYTYVLPKPMMPVGDKAILEILLRQMKHAGINHVVLTVGHLAGLMQAFFQDGQQYDLDINHFFEFHHQQEGICTIAMHERQVKIDLGVIERNHNDFQVTDYIEKPTLDYSVSMGLYIFEPEVLKYIPQGEYLDFPNLVHKLLEAGEKVVGYPFNGYWMDLGNPEDYAQANQDFERMRGQFLPEI